MAKLAGWLAERPRPGGLCRANSSGYIGVMRIQPPAIDTAIDAVDTIADLRELYRASEARAARLRLLSDCGRILATADSHTIEEVLQRCALQLAYFVGRARALVSLNATDSGMAILAPGQTHHVVGRIAIEGLSAMEDVTEREDQDAFRMHLELMGAAIDRIQREREKAQLLATLQEREQRLEHLVAQIFSAQEEERRRVSHELHDGVAQQATALVRMLEGGSSTSGADIPASDRARLAAIARDLVTELRGVIGGLRPTLLDDLGLEAALHALAETLRGQGFDVTICLPSTSTIWSRNLETALFRVAQEAINNIHKHASPGCRVEVELQLASGDAGSFMRIQDFGIGSHTATHDVASTGGTHVGIDVMRERMSAVGGQLLWESNPGRGVTVVARFSRTT